jgi:hypothetical protein
MRGRKNSCPSGGNEKKERRKEPRWVRKDKDRNDGGQMGGRTQGQIFVGVQKALRYGPQTRRSGRTSHRTLNPAQGLERGRDGGQVKVMTFIRA